jgi:hypothetical protein
MESSERLDDENRNVNGVTQVSSGFISSSHIMSSRVLTYALTLPRHRHRYLLTSWQSSQRF